MLTSFVFCKCYKILWKTFRLGGLNKKAWWYQDWDLDKTDTLLKSIVAPPPPYPGFSTGEGELNFLTKPLEGSLLLGEILRGEHHFGYYYCIFISNFSKNLPWGVPISLLYPPSPFWPFVHLWLYPVDSFLPRHDQCLDQSRLSGCLLTFVTAQYVWLKFSAKTCQEFWLRTRK